MAIQSKKPPAKISFSLGKLFKLNATNLGVMEIVLIGLILVAVFFFLWFFPTVVTLGAVASSVGDVEKFKANFLG